MRLDKKSDHRYSARVNMLFVSFAQRESKRRGRSKKATAATPLLTREPYTIFTVDHENSSGLPKNFMRSFDGEIEVRRSD